MMRTAIICATLVATSAAGSVALSVLHGIAPEYRVKAMAPAPAMPEQRFVIPTFAPATRDTAISSAVHQAPARPVLASTADWVPVVQAPVTDGGVLAEPVETVAQPVGIAKQTEVDGARQRATPQIVARATTAVSDTPTIKPTYLIGVYR